jgi:hypothetical protein
MLNSMASIEFAIHGEQLAATCLLRSNEILEGEHL